MEVTGVNETVNSLVAAKPNATHGFKMADSAEFYHVLSSALYSEPVTAAIRETICNAWDAHRMVNKTDSFIDIQFDGNTNSLTIRDYGPGIPNDKIADIYLTYGASTKTQDDNQTGGFGLGCKSPFAVSESFNVTNYNNFSKTEYIASKSDNITGKPSFVSLYTIPSEETGLSVQFSFNKTNNPDKIVEIVKYIVNTGGIKAKLNGEELEYIDYSSIKNNYMFSNFDKKNTLFYVKYGDVVYPLNTTLLNNKLNNIQSMLRYLNEEKNYNYRYNQTIPSFSFIIIMEPNSIALTPSREQINYTERTINNINKTFTDIHDDIFKNIEGIKKYYNKLISNYIVEQAPSITMNQYSLLAYIKEYFYPNNVITIKNKEDIGKYLAICTYNVNQNINYILKAYIKKYNNTLINGDLKVLTKKSNNDHNIKRKFICQKKIISKLIKDYGDYQIKYVSNHHNKPEIFDIDNVSYYFKNINGAAINFAHRYVVIASSQRSLSRLSDYNNPYNNLTSKYLDNYIVVIGSRTKKKVDAITKILEDKHYKVIDLTKHNDWEPEKEQRIPSSVKREVKKGLILFSEVNNNPLYNKYKYIMDNRDTLKRSESFKTVSRINRCRYTKEYNSLMGYDINMSNLILDAYANQIGFAYSDPQYNKAIKENNLPHLKDYLKEDLENLWDNNASIKRLIQIYNIEYQSITFPPSISEFIKKINKYKDLHPKLNTIDTNIDEINLTKIELILSFISNKWLKEEILVDAFKLYSHDMYLTEYVPTMKKLNVLNIDNLLQLDPQHTKDIVSLVLSK